MEQEMIIELDRQDDVCVLRFKGRLASGQNSEYVVAKWAEIKKLSCGKVLLDFREVPAIASMGIGFVVTIYTSVKNSGGRFVLVGPLPLVQKVFDITKISTVIPIASDLASGLSQLRA
jgi:anti-sigma B factor antagonist